MSNTRYLEFDSTYRNRNEWPLPGEFEIPISQTGRKNQFFALDPVSLSVPLVAWTPHFFDRSAQGNVQVPVSILPIANTTSITNATDPGTVIISATQGKLQQLPNYYAGSVISFTNTSTVVVSRRILSYKFLSSDVTDGDIAEIIISPTLPDTVTYGVYPNANITDPSDISSLANPYLFIPGDGSQTLNGYISYLIYNETRLDYRPIAGYDATTGLAHLDTSTLGNIPITWTLNDNYSLRLKVPSFPALNSGVAITVLANGVVNGTLYTTTTSTVVLDFSAAPIIPSSPANSFKNWALRILTSTNYPYISGEVSPAPVNESVVINSSQYDPATNLAVFTVSTFTAVPSPGDDVEILAFSYDNCNPFEYDGSLVSQQQNVCYEVSLLNVTLPNLPLAVASGGRIAFYPYVYVTLSNSTGANGPNLLYSNNPNSTKVTFRAPVYDVNSPLISTFVNIDGRGMDQVMKFKPNDNMYFSVTLPNGQVYQTVITDTVSPARPNPYIQISAAFSIRRVTVSPIVPGSSPMYSI